MSTRLKLAAGAATTFLAICLFVTASRWLPEPTYKGLTMEQALRSGDAGCEALLVLGTNNLQLLVKRVGYDPKKDLPSRLFSQLYRLTGSTWMYDIASRRRRLADDAQAMFYRLGPIAAPAIPQLARIVEHGGPAPSLRAMVILTDLGDEGVAIVASRAGHSNAEMRKFVVMLLGSHTDLGVARSALTNALNDPDPGVRVAASLSSSKLLR